MAPSLSDLYQIIKLPRISNIPIESRCVVGTKYDNSGSGNVALPAKNVESSGSTANSKYLHLAISSSSISTYVLIPSPKLVWSHSLSPSVIVNHLAVFQDLISGTMYFAASVYNSSRKKHFLKIIVNHSFNSKAVKSSKSQEDGSKEGNAEELITVNVELDQEIKSLTFSKNGKIIYVLFASGDVKSFTVSADIDAYEQPTHEFKSVQKRQATLIYSKHISSIDAPSGSTGKNIIVNNNDGFLLLVRKVQGNKIVSSILLLANGEIAEVSSNTVLESGTAQKTNEEYIFSYNSGILYQLAIKEQSLSLYSLPQNDHIKTISLASLFGLLLAKNTVSSKDVGLVSPSLNRVLLNVSDSVFLINTKFETVLSDYKLPTTARAADDDRQRSVLLNIGEVKGTAKNTATSLNLLMLHNDDNNYSLHNLAVDVGNSSLVESLGKGIELFCERKAAEAAGSHRKHSFKESLVFEYLVSDEAFNNENTDQQKSLGVLDTEEVSKVENFLKNLTTTAKQKNSQEFDRIFISFIKRHNYKIEKIQAVYSKIDILTKNNQTFNDEADEWKDIKKIIFKVSKSKKDYAFSYGLFHSIFELIFNVDNGQSTVEYGLKSKKFLPQLSIIYLINSHMFPPALSLNYLLRKFKSEPIILNTIVTNYDLQLSVEDILLLLSELSADGHTNIAYYHADIELKSDKNQDLLMKKLIKLLITSKSETQIVKVVKVLLNSSSKEHEVFNMNFEKLIYKIIELNYGIKLLNLIIDGIGILNFKFNNDENKLTELIRYSEYKVAEISKFEPVDGLLGEVIVASEKQQEKQQLELDREKAKKKAITAAGSVAGEHQPKIVSVKNTKVEDKLNAIVSVHDDGNDLDDNHEDKIPAYSVERLVNLY